MDKPGLDELRARIWSELAEDNYIPRITPAEALTPQGGWKMVLLAEVLLNRHEQERNSTLGNVDRAFKLLSDFIDLNGLKVLMADGQEEEWASIYVAAIWLLRRVVVYKPEVVPVAIHCYQLSTMIVPDEYRQAAKELVPEIAATARRILDDRWLD